MAPEIFLRQVVLKDFQEVLDRFSSIIPGMKISKSLSVIDKQSLQVERKFRLDFPLAGKQFRILFTGNYIISKKRVELENQINSLFKQLRDVNNYLCQYGVTYEKNESWINWWREEKICTIFHNFIYEIDLEKMPEYLVKKRKDLRKRQIQIKQAVRTWNELIDIIKKFCLTTSPIDFNENLQKLQVEHTKYWNVKPDNIKGEIEEYKLGILAYLELPPDTSYLIDW